MTFTLNIQTSLNGEWELVNAGFARNGSDGSGGHGGSGGSGGDGWLWEPHRVECTATNTITYTGIDGVEVTYTETFPGTKRSCTDGNSLCLSTLCG
ncbi:hypothetical protein [Cyclobacterium marinum]|uniref:Uncharacterized protein n=1 Tax=Cyclobacterium marinum (strain ATCC 25205 / DSM 745 / LMG 13164 / NCIMB 1802) TaxID=880070 RepID=G0J453_CYCMS|nr:hypothetical protein [Cyclobacterium marinum]AEL26719.1 hypothetical protein Cycma_2990 [Cyclobacterium marinum DSM 745]